MRRKDKQIDDVTAIESIIRRASVCRLAMCDGNRPYIVPLCFGYKDNALYFHSSGQGKKLEILKGNPNVCFEFDIDTKLIKAEKPCDWAMRYKSIVGFGKAELVEDIELKREGLDIIMRQYSQATFEYPQEAIANITIIKVAIENMTGRVST
ncbi:MAG: pyridoxamine 5'-phosphate oxidase family protein [Planctomycetota bacterium]|jgi:nitroimidazol reductase NimA-like FMN-containing flavoprotein (pyridoxamine 5'-phosphate oxidase superfamily)